MNKGKNKNTHAVPYIPHIMVETWRKNELNSFGKFYNNGKIVLPREIHKGQGLRGRDGLQQRV